MKETLIKFITGASISTGMCVSADTSPLLTALITFGVTLITVVGSELIKYLTTYLRNKRQKLEEDIKDETKDGEQNG